MKRHYWILLGLFLLAFAVRLAYWERSAAFGPYDLSYDDDEYYKLSLLFSKGEFFRDPYPLRYTRAPGFPLALAPVFAVFGPRIEIALAFQVMVSVLTVALIYAVARRAFGKNAGIWAAGLMALAPTYASTAGSFLLTETLFVFSVLLFLYLLWRWTEQGLTLRRALAAGLLLGVCVLIRPSVMYFSVIAVGWYLFHERAKWKVALPRAVLLLVGMAALILPYTVRNYIVYDRVMLVDSLGGWNIWRDHRTPDDDFWTTLPTIVNPADRDRYAMQRGIQNILADPVNQIFTRGFANLGSTMRLELDSYARGAGYLNDVIVDAPTLPLTLWNDIFYTVVVIIGIGGILLMWQRGQILTRTPLLWWLIFFLVLTFLEHTQSRFRAQYTFILILYASAALALGPALLDRLSRPARVLWVSGAALALFFAYSPLLPPLFASEYYLTQSNGRDIPIAQKGVDAFPEYVRAYDNLGDAYRRAGDFTNGVEAYNRALKLNPYEAQARLGRVDIFRQDGNEHSLTREINALAASNTEYDIPAVLFWQFDPGPTRLVELGNNAFSFGYTLNFFAVQRDGEVPMRFTRDRSFLKFPGTHGWDPKTLIFYARGIPIPNQPLPTITVRINGRAVADVPLTDQWVDHEIPLDDLALAQDTLVVEFRSPTFRPSETLPGSIDTRDLGFALSYVELR